MEIGISIAFWVLAIVAVVAALAVVLVRNVFHAALFLVLCFISVAGLFITLSADFVAVAQILIYAGAIAILLIFAIMMTRDIHQGNPSGQLRFSAFFIAALMLVTFIFVVLNTDWHVVAAAPLENTTSEIANALFNKFVLPFEVASVLLLAAMIGAIILARERTE